MPALSILTITNFGYLKKFRRQVHAHVRIPARTLCDLDIRLYVPIPARTLRDLGIRLCFPSIIRNLCSGTCSNTTAMRIVIIYSEKKLLVKNKGFVWTLRKGRETLRKEANLFSPSLV